MENVDKRNELMERQYKLAIEARDKLNDNYHKWMTFYYIANGAVLVAITSLFNNSPLNHGILTLSIIGLVISLLWSLSCKGYNYWSKNWINIIILFEKNLTQDNLDLKVYSIFSKEVANENCNVLIPYKPANISTPKLTLIFSYSVIICWLTFSIFRFFIEFPEWDLTPKIIISIMYVQLVLIAYTNLLPQFAKSRDVDTHILV